MFYIVFILYSIIHIYINLFGWRKYNQKNLTPQQQAKLYDYVKYGEK